ncbi:PSII 6.1 kDa protein [Cymbomonas tetramitiformis]|uniref:Photosystem II reaction center Psb28 protein n=1 Tax=Cymbomonas tetramitiformis TaxID=36881 RepID=A0AAE0C7T0_9CHLO|nr:PSII 6.1 kDa protein [Cymbomonas tetramitiformis]
MQSIAKMQTKISAKAPSATLSSRQGVKLPKYSAGARGFSRKSQVVFDDASLQFIKGVNETCVPDVKLTRSRTGTTGTATFSFEQPSVFEAQDEAMGEITGLFMIDDEGELSTTDVTAKFINGKPSRVEARYVMRTSFDWERFMRFMERYAEDNGLGFQGK